MDLSPGTSPGLTKVAIRFALLKGTPQMGPIELVATTELRDATSMTLGEIETRVATTVRDRISAAIR